MRLFIILMFVLLLQGCNSANSVFVEAESFADRGGWVVDNQSFETMGSPYLMAHGLGRVVEDATTEISATKSGNYYVWVRTRDWTKRWGVVNSPGKFQLSVNGVKIDTLLGTQTDEWNWQSCGKTELSEGVNKIALSDLTGFNGRVDAIYFTTEKLDLPPNELKELNAFRREKLKLSSDPIDGGNYDLVVVGGGMAGCSAAISAARNGLKVALIQNRGVLGGNNSSEVRVGLSGLIMQNPYPNLGNLSDELGGVGHWNIYEAKKDPFSERSKQIMELVSKYPDKAQHNAGVESNYADDKKLALIEKEKNIDLFLNTHLFDVKMKGSKIDAVLGKNIYDSKEYIFKGSQFVDCTGDATLGYLAGAKYSIGRESKSQTGEQRAPEKADSLVMGASIQWYAVDKGEATEFAECDWAVKFTQDTYHKLMRGDWDWEAGMNDDQIFDIEYIRDHALRCVFGNWDFLKNKSLERYEFENMQLDWVAYIGGKRESRRLIGDVVLTEHDLLNRVDYEDASFTTTWGIDLHYPVKPKLEGVDQYRSYADIKDIDPYAVPYRCLYSVNIENMFMAGRNISVSHVALGTVRVMRTTGMMGEVVGMAASICKKHGASPREVYTDYLGELKEMMEKGVGERGFASDLKQ